MASRPKSFWVERDRVDPESQWVTHHDDLPIIAQEAEIIYACAHRGLALPVAEEMELWEIAAYLGMHRKETRAEFDAREIVEQKQEEWEATEAARMERLAEYAERRRARKGSKVT